MVSTWYRASGLGEGMATGRAATTAGAWSARFIPWVGSGILDAAVRLDRGVLGSRHVPLGRVVLQRASTHAGG
jgi:hypothetical protein